MVAEWVFELAFWAQIITGTWLLFGWFFASQVDNIYWKIFLWVTWGICFYLWFILPPQKESLSDKS